MLTRNRKAGIFALFPVSRQLWHIFPQKQILDKDFIWELEENTGRAVSKTREGGWPRKGCTIRMYFILLERLGELV